MRTFHQFCSMVLVVARCWGMSTMHGMSHWVLAMMSKCVVLIAVGMIMTPAVSYADVCFSDQKIVSVNTGYVNLPTLKGADGGDAVYFTLENGAMYPLAYSYNLDWQRGQALHRVLMAALVGGHRITGHDHNGTKCDDIDEIQIKR